MSIFASINATTETRSETLSFTDEQGANIVLPHSLFQETIESPEPNILSLERDLEDLKKRDTRFLWHSITLSEYWREKRIPRGLRLNKAPSFGRDDTDFMHKWEQILNKCSLDLMLLTIEKTKTEKEKIDAEIRSLESKIKARVDTETFNTITNKIMISLRSFQQELQSYKLKKYERDTKDYAEGKIYQWKKEGRSKPQKTRPHRQLRTRVNLSTSASEWDSSQTSDVDSQRSTQPFLGNAIPRRQGQRGGARGDGGNRGGSIPRLRRSQRNRNRQ